MSLSIVLLELLQMYSASCQSFELSTDQVCIHCIQPNPQSLRELPLSELVELFPAIACSFVTTSYIIQKESTQGFPSQVIFRIIHFDFIRNVSPGLALGSCLVLGCCLSSYTHRRRDQDQYQAIVFIVWIVWAICIGLRVGASANMVTLGVVPWGSCAAMLSSFFGHAGARWFSTRGKRDCVSVHTGANEKG
ncbi:hypothetical protein F4821DRAFT_82424 [Hypoxylon rubiginosum]|uniref:Uncharacterized protein n=1 Tax=Hypoxylon rubiginosum TaxID=110542 RepID=A0ACC0D8G1_9PEZI|nr:hypothetical protein F4821DRAFT_82424 [Hypoxylon rubiginosum]